MIKYLTGFLIVFLFIFTPVALAQNNLRSGENTTLERGEVINKDFFATGEKVTISGVVNGDVYASGGNILVDGEIKGGILAGGGNINITGKVTGNIRAAGGNINIAGEVGRNISVVGGNINIENGATVLGSLVAGAGNVQVFGPVGKGMTVGAGSLTIGNNIGSDIVAGVGQIDLTSNAKVGGDLVYYSEEKIGIAKEATVAGQITQQFPPKVDVQPEDAIFKSINAGWNTYSFLAVLLLGLLMSWILPHYTERISGSIIKTPWLSLGIGILTLLIFPIIIFLLFITIVGVPLAIGLLGYYILLIFYVKFFAAIALGQKLSEYFKQTHGLFFKLIVGMLLLSVLGLIPVVGGIISLIAMILGLGADILVKKEMLLELRSKKIL